MADKKFYNCILTQVFSPCGEYLACGNIYGDIVIFYLPSILKSDEQHKDSPVCRFSVPEPVHPCCSMASTDNFLLVGCMGNIFGWSWESIKALKPKRSFDIKISFNSENPGKTEVNSLFVHKNDTNVVFAGCGDNMIYSFSLENGALVRKFSGHTGYLHSIKNVGWQMASGGEDGSVRLWDLRQNEVTNIIHPHQNTKLSRPHLGNWIGDVDITQDWLVCGGGPRLSLWHMRTLEMVTCFDDVNDSGIHVAQLISGYVLGGGADSHFYQVSYTGEIQSKIHTSSSTIYSALYCETPNVVLSLAGSSGSIDICTNFTYRHQILSFYT